MYKILFKNNEIYNGGDPENSLWNNIPDKPILSLKYSLFNKTYLFQGFNQYNHIIKAGLISNGYNGIFFVAIMGLYKGKVHRIIFDHFKKIIVKDIVNLGFEKYYDYQKNIIHVKEIHPNWKEGIVSNKIPTIYEI